MSKETVFDVSIGGFGYEILYRCKSLSFTETSIILKQILDDSGNETDMESIEVRDAPVIIEKKTIQHEQEVKQWKWKT